MITTLCWSSERQVDYAFEGVIVTCGATIEWLKNELGLFKNSSDTEQMAASVPNNNGVYLIPAFSGLGAPHWDMSRKAEITGLTFDCNKNHIARAALEAIAFQIKDVIVAMEQDAGIRLNELMVNGGMTANNLVLQLIADVLKCNLVKGDMLDVSALGAGLLAGLKAGIFSSVEEIAKLKRQALAVHPQDGDDQIQDYYREWLKHVKRVATISN
jgi:glycerol kinase